MTGGLRKLEWRLACKAAGRVSQVGWAGHRNFPLPPCQGHRCGLPQVARRLNGCAVAWITSRAIEPAVAMVAVQSRGKVRTAQTCATPDPVSCVLKTFENMAHDHAK